MGKRGAAWETYACPPYRLSKHETWRFTARLAHVATRTQHTSLHESLLHVLQTRVLVFAAPKGSSVVVPQAQRLIWREGTPRSDHTMNQNYLAVLTPIEASQRVCLWQISSSHWVNQSAKHELNGGARPTAELSNSEVRSGCEATFLAKLEQRAEIAISLCRQF